ncbi:unnamed protein product, partial [Rotaria sp. Silwood1]
DEESEDDEDMDHSSVPRGNKLENGARGCCRCRRCSLLA